jgi:hypothetical protein
VTNPEHFLDFEASGFHPDSYPIALAICSPNGTYAVLIKPTRYWTYWSPDAEDMHGIPRHRLISEGIDPKALAFILNEKFLDQAVCCDNPADCFWLEMLFEAAEMEPRFRLLPLESWVGQASAADILRLMPALRAHNALKDAQALQQAFGLWLQAKASIRRFEGHCDG